MTERPDDTQIAVIFLKASKERGNDLLKYLAGGLDGLQGLEIGGSWEELDGGELQYQMRRYSHVIMLLDKESRKSRWLPFLFGFCSGADTPLYFFSDTPIELPSYLSPVRRFVNEHALLNRLIEDVDTHEVFQRVENAREELIGRGYGLNDEALVEASRAGDGDVVELYLIVGYSVDTADSRGVSMLNYAIREDHGDLATMLLESGADPNVISEDRGNTPLMDAAAIGSEEMVSLLIAAGANVDIQSKSGQTALMMAVGEKHAGISGKLISAGADLNLSDQLGMTAEKYARLFNHEEIVALFSE